MNLPVQSGWMKTKKLHEETLREKILAEVESAYREKRRWLAYRHAQLEKQVFLQVLIPCGKNTWPIWTCCVWDSFAGYAQKNPKQEYKRESFELFQGMLDNIKGRRGSNSFVMCVCVSRMKWTKWNAVAVKRWSSRWLMPVPNILKAPSAEALGALKAEQTKPRRNPLSREGAESGAK